MSAIDIFSPFRLGPLTLPNRMVMAPMTRNRAGPGNAPTALNATYYAQRASAGLIVAEASQVSPQGLGYPGTPGIHDAKQIAGWKLVTDAVHEAGGRIFLQLWHVGRISHVSLQPNGAAPVAPSAIRANTQTFIASGFADVSEPHALTIEDIKAVIRDYVKAAENAKKAGFDGVEVHGANGYLIDQFLKDKTNRRTDAYGGSIDNRLRFALEVVDAVLGVWPRERVGIRLSPVNPFNDIADSDPARVFFPLVAKLSERGIAYIHVIEGQAGGPRDYAPFDYVVLRKSFSGAYIANNGYTRELAIEALREKHADLIAFGKLFIANPDLVERFRRNAPLNTPQQETFYGGDAHGYTDYPALA